MNGNDIRILESNAGWASFAAYAAERYRMVVDLLLQTKAQGSN